ncbi:unnamed protein product [Allacma fusca]|uniref:Uncharacterized protein n=1 Tax=Allacma fusca TaxID=39272 RepID=A0A8J2PHP5_9HEXA|nr:unnamed protein product [Allacma fusca]
MSSNELKVEPVKTDGSASPRSMAKLYRTQKELLTPETSKLTGKLPSWVKGTYIRTGPGKFDFDNNFEMNHFMDGYAIITKFEIDEEEVKFSKKFLETDAYKKAMIAQKPVICEYGTHAQAPDPTKSRFSRFIPTSLIPELSDNSNINLFNVGDNVCVTGETCYFRELDAETLESGDKFDTNKMLGLQNAAAHPLTDEDGTIYNVGSSLSFKYNIFKIPNPGDKKDTNVKDSMKKSKVICQVPTSHTGLLSYNHSFGMTKNYFILIEQPFVLNVGKIVGALMSKGYSFSDWLEWRPELKNRFHVIEKATGKILKTEIWSDTFFFLHIINCFEMNNQIVLDITTFPDPTILNSLDMGKLRRGEFETEPTSVAQRFVLPIVDVKEVAEGVNLVNMTGTTVKTEAKAVRQGNKIIVTPDTMTEKGLELPVINRRFLTKKTSYFYATGSVAKGYFENSLCKVHTTKKETFLFKDSDTYYFGEPTFVANPEAKTEDDGILITAVTDIREGSNDFLVFVDARNMEEIARAEFKHDIPQALHGIFLPFNPNNSN